MKNGQKNTSKCWAELSRRNEIDVNLQKPETIPAKGMTQWEVFLLALRILTRNDWDEYVPFRKSWVNLHGLEAGFMSAWASVLKHFHVLLIKIKCPGNNSKPSTPIWRHMHTKFSNKSTLKLCFFRKKNWKISSNKPQALNYSVLLKVICSSSLHELHFLSPRATVPITWLSPESLCVLPYMVSFYL